MITQIDHIALAVKDLDAAIDAYQCMFGLEPNWIGGGGGARHAWFQLPNSLRHHQPKRRRGLWRRHSQPPGVSRRRHVGPGLFQRQCCS